jgi:MinD-like ATPase involved in chromosome partitioning or flagellar assembly
MSKPIIVVAGTPNVAQFLQSTSFFDKVYNVTTMSELKQIVTSPELRNANRTQLTFICGDSIDENDPSLNMSDFLRKITTAGYNTIVVSVTAKGADMQRQNPRAKLLQIPITLNDILYAISSFGYPINPVDEGGVNIPVHPLQFSDQSAGAAQEQQVNAPSVEEINNTSVVKEPPVAAREVNPNATSGWVSVQEVEEKPLTGPAWTPANNVPQSQVAPDEPQVVAKQRIPGQVEWDDSEIFQEEEKPYYLEEPSSDPNVEPGSNWAAAPAPSNISNSSFEAQPNSPSSQGNWGAPAAPVAPAAAPTQNPPSWGAPPESGRKTLSGLAGAAPTESAWYTSPGVLAPQSREGYDVAQYGAQRRGFVITVSTSKGGTGKSSLSLNLAAFLGMRLRSQGKTVCIIDANTQQADTGKYLDVYRPNINTIVNDPSLLTEENIMTALVHKPEYNLSALLGPATPDEANPLAISARLYSQVLDLLRKHFDYIIIDTAVAEKFHEMFSQFALPKADYIVVPVAPNFTTLHNADNWLRSAVAAPKHEGGAGIDPSRIGIVLNRAEEGIGCSEADVRATLASWHFIGSVPETKEWKAANNRNELIAPKNYAELSHAFAEVLHAATREPILTENFALMEEPKKGIGSKFKKILGRN